MSQRMQQGQPMIIMGEDAQRVKDRDAQEYNIRAARAVAEAVRSTLGPKGMDKMLVDSMGDVTITNDGVTILTEMDIDNPTAAMIVEVAETQEDEAGDGTTTAVAIAGELLKNAEDLLEQDIHPTAIIRGFNMAATQAKDELDDIATDVDPDDEELLKKVAETSMTGKSSELNKELLAQLIVARSRRDRRGRRRLRHCRPRVPHHRDPDRPLRRQLRAPRRRGHRQGPGPRRDGDRGDDADVLLVDTAIELDETEVDAQLSVDDPSQLQNFLDKEEEQLKQKVDQIVDSGADVVFCQKGIDDLAQHYLAKQGILAVRRRRSPTSLPQEHPGAASSPTSTPRARTTWVTAPSPATTPTACSTSRAAATEPTASRSCSVVRPTTSSTNSNAASRTRSMSSRPRLPTAASSVAAAHLKSKSPAGSATTPTASKAANSSLSSPSPTRWRSSRAPSPRTLVSTASTRSSTCAPPTRTAMSAPA